MVIVVSCPECGRVASVVDRCVLESTDGPVEHSCIRCSAGHHFLMPTEGLAGLLPSGRGAERSHEAASGERMAACSSARTSAMRSPTGPSPSPTVCGRGRRSRSAASIAACPSGSRRDRRDRPRAVLLDHSRGSCSHGGARPGRASAGAGRTRRPDRRRHPRLPRGVPRCEQAGRRVRGTVRRPSEQSSVSSTAQISDLGGPGVRRG